MKNFLHNMAIALVMLWLAGFFFPMGGWIIHLLLLAAFLVVVYRIIRRSQ